MPLNDRNDPQMSYRRGYQDGAFEMLRAIERFLDPLTRDVVRAWIEQDINGWRLKAMLDHPPTWRLTESALEHVLHHHGEAIKSSPHVRPAGHPDLRAPTVSGSSPAGLQGIGEPCRVRRRHILRQAQNPAIAQHHLDS